MKYFVNTAAAKTSKGYVWDVATIGGDRRPQRVAGLVIECPELSDATKAGVAELMAALCALLEADEGGGDGGGA